VGKLKKEEQKRVFHVPEEVKNIFDKEDLQNVKKKMCSFLLRLHRNLLDAHIKTSVHPTSSAQASATIKVSTNDDAQRNATSIFHIAPFVI
jgi:hypothetical protein